MILVLSRPKHISLLRQAYPYSYSTATATASSSKLASAPGKQVTKRPTPSPSPKAQSPPPKPVNKLTPPPRARTIIRERQTKIEERKQAEREKPLDDAELLKDLEKNIERAKLKPDFHIWDQPIATLDVHIPTRIFNPNKEFWDLADAWNALKANVFNHAKNALLLYRLVRENNVPGIYYIPYASFSHRLFVWTPRYFRVATADPEAPKEVPIVKNVRRPPQLLQKVSNKVRRLFFGRQKKPETKEEETTEKVTEVAKEEPKEKKTEDWMSGMRTIAEETYKHLMDAIATNNTRKIKILTTTPYQTSLNKRLSTLSSIPSKKGATPVFKWRFHGHNTPLRVLSIRGTDAYLEDEPPAGGASRLVVQALVRFDTMQSLELVTASPFPERKKAKEPEMKRVVEYLVFEKRLFNTNAPWVIRDELFVEEGKVGKWD